MIEKKVYSLNIDETFKSLIRPLHRTEYDTLVKSLQNEGCRDPIVVWDGTIVDGHNRYDICKRYNIPFPILEVNFDCRAAAMAWICANQLGRRNLSEESRKYLIGMQYDSEKMANKFKNANGYNQWHKREEDVSLTDEDGLIDPDTYKPGRHVTAERVAKENHVSPGSVIKYSLYARALESIREKVPDLVPKILSGRYKIAHENVIELSKKSVQEILDFVHDLDQAQPFVAQYKTTRQALPARPIPKAPLGPSVKDMPAFDPDAEVAGLTLTVPSWVSSIDRTLTNSDLKTVSGKAKENLAIALTDLITKISALLIAIKEEL